MYVHIPGAEKAVARLFGGVKPHMRLSPEEMELVKPLVVAARRSIVLRLVLVSLAIMACGGVLLAVRLHLDGPSVNPVVDDRVFKALVGLGVLAIVDLCFVPLVLGPIMIRSRMGDKAELFDSYLATKEGWLPRRLAIVGSVITLPIGLLGLLCIIALGTRVDDKGIIGSEGLLPHRHSYSEVTSVELYSQLMAPIGLRTVPNLVVRFKDGTRFIYMPDDNKRLPPPEKVAGYIADRSSVPLTVGTLRPK